MRIADQVTYLDAAGSPHTATITKVPGTGASGCKTLDLTYQRDGTTVVVEDVPHRKDQASPPYWLELGGGVAAAAPAEAPKKARGKK